MGGPFPNSVDYFPLKQAGSEDPFGGERGVQRRARFVPCLLVLVFCSLSPLQPVFGALLWLLLAVIVCGGASAKLCPSRLRSLVDRLVPSGGEDGTA
jgi:hypothetical protein